MLTVAVLFVDIYSTSASIATLPPFGPIEGQKWFDQIYSQLESQKNRFAFNSFGKIRFLPPCIWNLPFVSYRLWVGEDVIDWCGRNRDSRAWARICLWTQESIPRNRFRQPMWLGGPVRKIGCRPARLEIDSWAPQMVYKYGLWFCNHLKEPRNRFLGSLNLHKFGLRKEGIHLIEEDYGARRLYTEFPIQGDGWFTYCTQRKPAPLSAYTVSFPSQHCYQYL